MIEDDSRALLLRMRYVGRLGEGQAPKDGAVGKVDGKREGAVEDIHGARVSREGGRTIMLWAFLVSRVSAARREVELHPFVPQLRE
jgi:hypothetical protein